LINTHGKVVGDVLGKKKETDLVFKDGMFSVLSEIPLGSLLHSISLGEHKKIIYGRSAGTFIKLLQKDFELNVLKSTKVNVL